MTQVQSTETVNSNNLVIPVIPTEPPSEDRADKLYLVTHSQLSAGYQIAQVAHVVAEFINQHPTLANQWHSISNSIIVLEAKNARELSELQEKAIERGLKVTAFREPDIGDEITALAFEPSEDTRKFLSNLPCAGKKLHQQDELRHREHVKRTASFAMMECEQTKGQNVLQHGRSVREHYFALVNHLTGRVNLHEASNWKIPAWLDEYTEEILATLPSNYVMDRYLTLHDSGKPAIREVDEDGRVHFPNHADASYKTYLESFATPIEEADAETARDEELIAYLIQHDMDVHMIKAADLEEFSKRPTAFAQLLAGLAEVTSNAAMFGGVDSTSFKIKFKQIDQRGKALCKLVFKKDGE